MACQHNVVGPCFDCDLVRYHQAHTTFEELARTVFELKVRIRAEATAEEPAPVLCHPTDPCAHGITGPCSKCQQPPLRTRAVTHDEAKQILSRFNASHFNNPGEHARYSIPARPDHDDDLLLAAYIEQNRARDTAPPAALTEQERAVLDAVAAIPEQELRSSGNWYGWAAPIGVAERARRAAERKGEKT